MEELSVPSAAEVEGESVHIEIGTVRGQMCKTLRRLHLLTQQHIDIQQRLSDDLTTTSSPPKSTPNSATFSTNSTDAGMPHATGQVFLTGLHSLPREEQLACDYLVSHIESQRVNIRTYASLQLTRSQEEELAARWRRWLRMRGELSDKLAAALEVLENNVPSAESIPLQLLKLIHVVSSNVQVASDEGWGDSELHSSAPTSHQPTAKPCSDQEQAHAECSTTKGSSVECCAIFESASFATTNSEEWELPVGPRHNTIDNPLGVSSPLPSMNTTLYPHCARTLADISCLESHKRGEIFCEEGVASDNGCGEGEYPSAAHSNAIDIDGVNGANEASLRRLTGLKVLGSNSENVERVQSALEAIRGVHASDAFLCGEMRLPFFELTVVQQETLAGSCMENSVPVPGIMCIPRIASEELAREALFQPLVQL